MLTAFSLAMTVKHLLHDTPQEVCVQSVTHCNGKENIMHLYHSMELQFTMKDQINK